MQIQEVLVATLSPHGGSLTSGVSAFCAVLTSVDLRFLHGGWQAILARQGQNYAIKAASRSFEWRPC